MRVRVTDGGASETGVLSAEVLLDVADPALLGALLDALAVEEVTGMSCMCHGDLAFEFFDSAGRSAAVVGFHHATHLRWPGWDGDALLRDGDAVLRWLAGQGVEGPAGKRDELHRRDVEMAVAEKRWRAAAPAGVVDLLDMAVVTTHTTGILPQGIRRLVAERLTATIPDPVERAAATLAWYGSGTGRCSGYPVHEGIPESALAATPIAVLVATLREHAGDARIEAGAVRHLCGWNSRDQQAKDVAVIPIDLRERLLAVAIQSGDDDKRARAEAWLR
ncbi:hypothetical protein GCM10023107_82960 [Actinoplanes octamycinicus]|nr:hypothetical protein Aoc01nite_35240 [Actinoplanes octamycinicus]